MPDDVKTQQIAIPEVPMRLDELLGTANLPVSLRIMLDDRLYEKTKQLAGVMSKAEGFTPKHLLGKPEACFIVVSCSLNWKIDPNFVARSTYMTPGGSIGFEGKLVQAVLEQSGRIVGGVTYEHTGDWNRVLGKFQIVTGGSGKPYPKATWTPADALGLGVIVRAQIKGEATPRVWPAEGQPFQLTQCFPLNSPLWATDPKTQIGYLAVRRFANQAVPHLLGGMPFDENELLDASERARDVTPISVVQEAHAEPVTELIPWQITDAAGEVYEFEMSDKAVEACRRILIASAADPAALATAWENNDGFLAALLDEKLVADRDMLIQLYSALAPKKEIDRPVNSPAAAAESGEPAAGEGAAAPSPVVVEAGVGYTRPPPVAMTFIGGGAGNPPAEPPQDERSEPASASDTPPQEHAPTGSVEPPEPRQPSADPFWRGMSLRVDPMPVRGGGSLSKLEWKTWPALMQPRLRQVWATDLLNRLYQDNSDHLDKYEEACGPRARDELVHLFDDARLALGEMT